MMWRRVHDAGAFVEVTDVYSNGTVHIWHFWEDNTVSLFSETTVQNLGYDSVEQFLEYRWDYRRVR